MRDAAHATYQGVGLGALSTNVKTGKHSCARCGMGGVDYRHTFCPSCRSVDPWFLSVHLDNK